MDSHKIVQEWRKTYGRAQSLDFGTLNTANSIPGVERCISSANIRSLSFGTGHSIYTNTIIPAIESAASEVIIVTCFWARSRTLDALNEALVKLSRRHCLSRQREDDKIRVRICFSSSSLLQKIFHTSSLAGRTYGHDEWARKFGLPPKDQLPGLDMDIKSIFVLPFSVMHSKFIVVDRAKVFLPSCNVSWEDWFEGCVELTGLVVDHFVGLWRSFWAGDHDRHSSITAVPSRRPTSNSNFSSGGTYLLASASLDLQDVSAIFLPSPHRQNPCFALPWQACPPPPSTPLNSFLLTAFHNAREDIYLQTPNLTAPPVLSALLAALKRGVDVTIVTSERLMILEQLITAGTTTKRCVAKLIKRHRKLTKLYIMATESLIESATRTTPGQLTIKFFVPTQHANENSAEPVQSHVKATIVDSELTVLGSGNMDRASWYTSQELGVAFMSSEFATHVRTRLDDLMRSRTRAA